MGQGDAALAHHLDEIAGAELKCQIPPDAQDDNFLVKVPAFGPLKRSCAEVGSVIPAVIARHRAFQQFAPELNVRVTFSCERRAAS